MTVRALSCEAEQPHDNIPKLYYSVMSNTGNIEKLDHNSLLVGDVYIKNINLSLIFNYKVDNIVISKLAFLTSPSYSEDEWGGYYYIVEASNKDFLNFKRKYHLSSHDITKTSLGNYRVTCTMIS
ncbi:hypothetical protein E0H86_00830 [Acinetobacter sp. ANC 4635]|uniref:hypothetical protein n=1 Tax=Acinetobacter sp. ANC 4635 TaxID=2529846 RepID=UPI00103C692B|nr:hypothetical protein [Acinetobacter sp. ANC 4635]TCB33220.1 hypothetical protein E0H86_00830 [Acinetobacter sp. ANC 4635]